VIAAAGVVAAALIALVVILLWPDPGPDVTTSTTTSTTLPPVVAGLGFPQIRVGDEGAVVVALQRLLTVKDHPVPVTGFFDDATEAATKALEQETNIPPDGIVGRVTWQQLAAPIRRGDSGPAVLAAEELLQLSGFDITPDDRFTNGTQDLVLQFQRRQGLPADGIIDVDTWRVLLALAFRAGPPPIVAGPPTTVAPATAAAPPPSVAPTTTPTTPTT
jgi:peptidoglycan hydrolase-like protein with peptidoglycan-binding domain